MNATRKVTLVVGSLLFAWTMVLGVLLVVVVAVSQPDGTHLTIPEDYSEPFDAKPGDTLTLVMHSQGDPEARCLDAGGTLVNVQGITYCKDVDF